VAYLQASIANGERHSVADAMLTADVLDRHNLHVQVNAHAHKILFDESKRAIGIEFNITAPAHASGAVGVKTVRINKEVILSAGSFGSPHILMLSGVGPREHLAEHGIPLVHHLPGVGENLQDHTQVGVTMSTTQLETFESVNAPDAIQQNFARWLLAREGPLTAILGQLQAYFKTKYAKEDNDMVDVHSLFAPTIFILDGMR
jgi:choline dehydrogenase